DKPGTYAFEISDGGATKGLPLHLAPEPTGIRIYWDLKGGQVSLNGGQPQDIQANEFAADVPSGTPQTLTLLAAGKEVLRLAFFARPGEYATLTAPMKSQDLDVVVIGSLTGHARVYG